MVNQVICVYKWYLPTLSEILTLADLDQLKLPGFPAQQQIRAEREWFAAVAALNQLLHRSINSEVLATNGSTGKSFNENGLNGNASSPTSLEGVLLSGPLPIVNQCDLASRIATWMFAVASPGEIFQLLPSAKDETESCYSKVPTLPLLPADPLAAEQFCLALTAEFSLVMVLGESADGSPAFLFSFEPEVVRQVWRSLEARIKLSAPQMLAALTRLVDQFPPVLPDYRTVSQFSRLMLAYMPQPVELEGRRSPQLNGPFQDVGKSLVTVQATMPVSEHVAGGQKSQPQTRSQKGITKGKAEYRKSTSVDSQWQDRVEERPSPEPSSDTELLQAIAHEVRTPLTTIRTLTRLLLRRKDLNPDVIKRLEIIDRECTEQIDRFSLIFRAVELETTETRNLLTSLAPISLDQVLQQNIPRWQQQASQHNHTLDIILPQKMPSVVTDPTMLDQVLTGLIDRITHSLPPGSHIQVRVALAGHQLKLQLESHPQWKHKTDEKKGNTPLGFAPNLKSIGQLLMFQPETGNLSLNLTATKNLFQALGGKLIVRQRPEQGEVLTIYLPLETRKE
jgi:signal transduction histidine kinase